MTITLHLLNPAGTTPAQTITARPGQSLMQAAVAAGVSGIAADCGGTLSCATCHVVVAEAWQARVPTLQRDEAEMLAFTASPRQAGSRLSCQLVLGAQHDGLVVFLPENQY